MRSTDPRWTISPGTSWKGLVALAALIFWVTAASLAQTTLPAVPAATPDAMKPVAPAFLVLIDAAHGGSETGARISEHLLEKDLTLSLSVRLRSTLAAHGIAVVTTRESDSDLFTQARAAAANRSHASACLLVHATASGTGVHLYTSSLSQSPLALGGGPRPWATAQSSYITQSLKLSSDLREALGHAGIPVTLGSVSLRQVDSMACPAVLLEVAPLLASRGQQAAALDDQAYQTRLIDALGGALEQWRSDWKAQP
jgi:N-acetylmuramoyl-L-alanine amidase